MNRLRELREAAGYGQREFGEKIGASQGAISHWESGRREMDAPRIAQLSSFFGVSSDYLLGYSIEKTDSDITSDSELKESILAILAELPAEKQKQALEYMRFIAQQK